MFHHLVTVSCTFSPNQLFPTNSTLPDLDRCIHDPDRLSIVHGGQAVLILNLTDTSTAFSHVTLRSCRFDTSLRVRYVVVLCSGDDSPSRSFMVEGPAHCEVALPTQDRLDHNLFLCSALFHERSIVSSSSRHLSCPMYSSFDSRCSELMLELHGHQ